MDHIKIQRRILNDAFARDEKNKKFEWLRTYNGKSVAYGENVYVVFRYGFYAIPKDRYYVEGAFTDTEEFKWETLYRSYLKEPNGVLLEGDKIVEYKWYKLRVLYNKENGAEIYLDNDLLKYFGKNACFYGNGPVNQVYVYEDDELVGMILPFRKEREKEYYE